MNEARRLPVDFNKVLIKEGSFGRKPALGWICLVNLKVNGELNADIRSDYLTTDTTEIVMGNGNWFVDRMIEYCLETMHVKEESAFNFKLKEDVELNIEITLESCTEKGYIYEWSDADKMEACRLYKTEGISLFRGNRIEHAFFKFGKAVKMLLLMDSNPTDEELAERSDTLMSLYNNLAICQYNFKNYALVVELCNKSVGLGTNIKGFFWRALANIELKNYESAESDLVELLKIEPGNRVALEKYQLVRSLNKENRDNYEAMVRNMFK